MIVQLLYVSTKVGMSVDQTDEYLAGARARNIARDITGLVLITDLFYIHCIEGERDIINKLFLEICKDPRHKNQCILRYNNVREREFSEFSAEISLLSDFETKGLNALCGTESDDMTAITPILAMSLIRRLAAHHRAKIKHF